MRTENDENLRKRREQDMKLKQLVSLAVSAAVTASCMGGFAVTASAEGETTLPADKVWTSNNAELMAAASAATDEKKFGPVDGLSGYGKWVNHTSSATYTHTNGTEYNFTAGFQAGSGSATKRSFYFTPEQACIVTVAYSSQAGRPVYIVQDGKTLASGEDGLTNGAAATITADIEDITKGDVYVYGGSSNKDIYGIFVDYYDPTVITYRKVSGAVNYSGTNDTAGMKIVFEDTSDNTTYTADFASTYSVDLRQNRTYDVYVTDGDGTKSDKVAVTLDTNSTSVAKMDKNFDISVVDIAPTAVKGDVVVHDVFNDGTSLDLSKVELTFRSASYEYTTGITDNKIDVTMMPNEEYTVSATGIDGYSLSPLSQSYVMAAGDTAPFKNILITENVDAVDYKSELTVGADKEFKTITDAITAVKKMTRAAGEDGRVTIKVDAGTYTEQVIVDAPYVTIKAADENNRPEIQWYYGVGYLYYSSAGNQYYSEDYAVAKTKKGPVTRWGSAVRITGTNVNMEGIIVRHTFNCFVSDAELADGVEPATHNEYSDVNGKPDRTVKDYDAKARNAVERAAAIAMDADYIELYNCDFISSQDTFYTNKIGYVKNCYIEGGTDYIFGGNSIVFEGCTLAWHGYSDQAIGGYITANKNGADPVPGTPNTAANGYLLKNCTVTTSKYYPNNKFAAGAWGRNWGGVQTQVVFDNIKVNNAATPSGWTKMGSELNQSILYVNNVTDKDGNPVDVSGTAYNPNGTMSANGYTPMAMSTYFGGTWVPAHYDASTDVETPSDPTSKPTEDPTQAPPGASEEPTNKPSEKPTAVPCDPLTPLTVEKLLADTQVTFTAGVTITEPTVIDTYVAAYAGTHEETARIITTDTSNKTINGTTYTTRLKLGGTGVLDINDAPAMRTISVTPAVAGTLVIDFAHGSSTGDAREFIAYQNGAVIGSKAVYANTTDTLMVAVTADEPVYLYSGNSGINIYGIKLVTGEIATPEPAATELPVTALPVNARVVFDAGYKAPETEGAEGTTTSYNAPTVFGDYVAVYADEATPIIIDGSSKTIGDTKYTTRIKLGGKVTYTAGKLPTSRTISVIPAEDGILTVDFAHGSGEGEARTLTAYQNGEAAATASAAAGATATLSAEVKAGVPVYISSADGAVNVYGIILTNGTAPEEPEKKVSCVKITATYENGVLANAVVENVEIEPSKAVPSTEGKTKTMYWESLDSMKPVKASSAPADDPEDNGEKIVPPTTVTVGEGAKLSADDIAQAEYTQTIVVNNFYIGADAGKDENDKNNGSITVDSAGSNGTTINGTKYTNRIKTGGSGDLSTGVRAFYFKVDSDCTMVMDATTSSTDVTRDVIVLHGDSEEHLNVLDKASYTVNKINAGETVIIYSAEGGFNVYGIALTPYVKAPTYSWTVSSADSGCAEGTELMPGLTTLFEDTAANGKYITNSVANGSISSGVVTGTALKYVAPKSGTLEITVNGLGADKSLCVMAEGGKVEDAIATVVGGGSGVDVKVSADVTEGTTYYIWAPGSKARFTAASLTEAE